MKMTKGFLLTGREWVLLWHGLLVASYTTAYVTAESLHSLHQFAGYTLYALLILRLLLACFAGERAPWSLPIPTRGQWDGFRQQVAQRPMDALSKRTPLSPLSALMLLFVLALVSSSGLAADWWNWEELHETFAEASPLFVFVHIALVSVGPVLRQTAAGAWLSDLAAIPVKRKHSQS